MYFRIVALESNCEFDPTRARNLVRRQRAVVVVAVDPEEVVVVVVAELAVSVAVAVELVAVVVVVVVVAAVVAWTVLLQPTVVATSFPNCGWDCLGAAAVVVVTRDA